MWVIPADWWEPGRVWGCDSRDAAGETLTFFFKGGRNFGGDHRPGFELQSYVAFVCNHSCS